MHEKAVGDQEAPAKKKEEKTSGTEHKAGQIKDKREEKLESKRDFAIAKLIKEHKDEDKQGKKARAA